jgi:phytol kinase
MFLMDDPIIASIGPATFIVLNFLSMRIRIFSAMEAGKQEGNWGTVYFPVTLLALVNLCFRGIIPVYAGAIGVFVMGWGDGLASAVGMKHAVRRYRVAGSTKSYLGSAVMFVASAIVVLIFSTVYRPSAPWTETVLLMPLATAAVATVVEALTPWGLDNLTVPLLTTLFYWQVFV